MQPLVEYNPLLTQEQKDNLFMTNFPLIEQAIQFQGISLLIDNHSMVQVTTTSGTPVNIPIFNGTFVSSGGLVVVLGSVWSRNSTSGDEVDFQLTIDGNAVSSYEGPNAISAVVVEGFVSMFFCANLYPGTHSIGINANSGSAGNSVLIGSTSFTSGYYVLEARQG